MKVRREAREKMIKCGHYRMSYRLIEIQEEKQLVNINLRKNIGIDLTKKKTSR